MTDIPIIFSGPMIRALLDGRKTMTRRMLYSLRKAKNGVIPASARLLAGHPPPRGSGPFPPHAIGEYFTLSGWQRVKSGDRLWVRERVHRVHPKNPASGLAAYTADGTEYPLATIKSFPSIHMPRHGSRLTLVVTARKIERVNDISEEDCALEGIYSKLVGVNEDAGFLRSRRVYYNGVEGEDAAEYTAKRSFELLWAQINGHESWDANQEVVCLSFRVAKANIDSMQVAA